MQKPRWSLLYASLPLMIFLLWLDIRMNLSTTGHEIFAIAIIVVIFTSMALWVNANQAAIENEQAWKIENFSMPIRNEDLIQLDVLNEQQAQEPKMIQLKASRHLFPERNQPAPARLTTAKRSSQN